MPADQSIYRCPVTAYYFDPLAVQRKLLLLSKGEVNSWLRDQRGDDEMAAFAADDKLVPVIRGAFGLQEVNRDTGQGHATSTCLSVLDHFLRYMDAKKEKGPASPTVLPCADCPQE